MPNIIAITRSIILSHYASYDQSYLNYLLLKVNRINPVLKGFIIECLRLTTGSTSVFKKNALLDFIERVVYKAEQPRFFRVNEGEDFCFRLDVDEDADFTGFFLTIRNAETQVLLSPNNIAGSNESEQSVTANDLPLAAGSFYKIHVNLEKDTGGGIASGDAATLLADALLVVRQNIDAV